MERSRPSTSVAIFLRARGTESCPASVADRAQQLIFLSLFPSLKQTLRLSPEGPRRPFQGVITSGASFLTTETTRWFVNQAKIHM